MATRKTVDQILDGAADILEKRGWVAGRCYDSQTGGSCALGAITRAAHPRLPLNKVDAASYVGGMLDDETADVEYYEANVGRKLDKRHVEAVDFFGRFVDKSGRSTDYAIYRFNDSALPSYEGSFSDLDPKIIAKSSRKVVKKLRDAAEAYRKQRAKAAKAA